MVHEIFLVRHGQDEDNEAKILNGHRNSPLTALGREQAALLSERFKEKYSVDVVVASPLQRAHDTARAIHAAQGLPETAFEVLDILKERDFGVLTGKPVTDIPIVAGDKILKTDRVDYFLEVEGAETFPALIDRARKVIEYVMQRHEGKRVALVGHGDINKMIRAAFMEWEWEDGLRTPYVGNTDVVAMGKAPCGKPYSEAVCLVGGAMRT